MKLVVLGATGGTGLQIVRTAIEHGHSVTAFVRSAEKLKPFAGNILIREGNLLDRDQLAGAIRGHDAVVSGFGPRLPVAKSDADLMYRFSVILTAAIGQANVRRVVVESSAFLFKDAIFPPAHLIGRLFFPGVVKDLSAMEQVIRDSGLDWTLVRPPQLTDGPYTGKYRVRVGHLPAFGLKISRADVADFLVKTAGDPESVRKIIGVSG